MSDLGGWEHVFGIKSVHLCAGFAGGIVRALINSHYTLAARISAAVVGGLTAGYGTPPAAQIVRRWLDLWGYPIGELEGSVGFLLGLVGMTVCEAVMRWARRWRDGLPER
ncbi:hypothetical protein [Chelatococcus asaccharovorans]|uniref:Uncharacterized protein n=1 Tax=Chelatococcus asaccharovorans TaxID=28210 RepID=A0A2V3UAE4_9HYPH|nr:hypothetical protein [Chelatococcus asaccharovorans]MBS7703165.1 hypothetical protein [Chelatococcus asaccharovorans]PXW61494.1 hypothetical protein C7450_1039 [Chelatococcus asaccharovorans]